MDNPHYVYILTNQRKTVLYTGRTHDLPQRLFRHNSGYYPNAFTKKYNVNILVYYEEHLDLPTAAAREKRLKRWHHNWKAKLVSDFNPQWHDLGLDLS